MAAGRVPAHRSSPLFARHLPNENSILPCFRGRKPRACPRKPRGCRAAAGTTWMSTAGRRPAATSRPPPPALISPWQAEATTLLRRPGCAGLPRNESGPLQACRRSLPRLRGRPGGGSARRCLHPHAAPLPRAGEGVKNGAKASTAPTSEFVFSVEAPLAAAHPAVQGGRSSSEAVRLFTADRRLRPRGGATGGSGNAHRRDRD